MIKYSLYLLVFIASLSFAKAQQVLPLNEAVRIALENDYNIMMAENNKTVAENNTNILNHAYLPQVSAIGAGKLSVQNSQSDAQDGTSSTIDGAKTLNYNASVAMNYTLFDGMYRSYNYSKSKELMNLSELQVRQVVESTIIQLIRAYYNVANLSEITTNYSRTLQISKSRYNRINFGVDYGKYTQLDVLNAQVDVNTDSVNYLNSLQDLSNAKHDLNLLLGRDINTIFDVDTVVNYLAIPSEAEAISNASAQNIKLLAANKNIDISDYDIRLLKTNRIPTLSLKGAYAYTANDYDTKNILDFYRVNGPSAEVSLSWSIFDGGRTRISLQNAAIARENYRISLEQTQREVNRDVINAYTSYENAQFVLEAEKANLATSKRNFDRSLEQYEMGQLTSIDFRQAQLIYLQSKTRLNNTKYLLKIYELSLYQIMGTLLQVQF